MTKVIVSYGQTWLDIAMQELGDIERVVELAQANSRSITDLLEAGEELIVPDFVSAKRSLVQMFRNKANRPASGETVISADPDTGSNEGIEFWALENDFAVS